jgi:hypothetical protein
MPGAGGGNQGIQTKAKKKYEISMTNDILEMKETLLDDFGNSRTVIEKGNLTDEDDDISILDKLSGFFMGEAKASETEPEKPDAMTMVPENVYESDYFDDVRMDTFGYADGGSIFIPGLTTERDVVPKYVTDGSGALVENPNYREGPGIVNVPTDQGDNLAELLIYKNFPPTPEGDLSRARLGASHQDSQKATKMMEDMESVYTEDDLVYNPETDKFELPPGIRMGDPKPPAEIFLSAIEQIEAERALAEAAVIERAQDDSPQIDKKEVDVPSSVELIAKESPNDLTKLNNFALWADGVSDAEALREAEAILDEIESRPTVTDRFKKAMGVALGAMLFGDDFVTAMNTGLGVVADDYTAEAKAAKEAADAQAELEKTIAAEARAHHISNVESARDFKESAALKSMELDAKSAKEFRDAEIARKNKNTTEAETIMNSVLDSVKDHKQYSNVASSDPTGEMNGFLRVLDGQMKKINKQLDLTDWAQREAMSSVLKKWMQERLALGDAAAPMSAYAEEMFVKSEAQRHINIDPNLIAPSRDYLLSENLMIGTEKEGKGKKERLYINPERLNAAPYFGTRGGTEATLELGELIRTIGASGLGEENTIKLLYKDFLDYRENSIKKNEGGIFKHMEQIAYEKGWGPFTHFVIVVLSEKGPQAFDENLGMNYDFALQGENNEVSNAALMSYLQTDTYDLEAIKEQLKK